MSRTSAVEDPIEQKLNMALVDVLYRNSRLGTLGSMLLSLLLGFALQPVAGPAVSMSWAATMVIVFGLRYLLVMSFLRRDAARRGTRKDVLAFQFGLLVSVLGWITGVFLFFDPSYPLHQSLLLVVVAGLIAFSPQALMASPFCSRMFVVPMILAVAAQFALQPNAGGLLQALVVISFGIFSLLAARSLHQTLRDNLRLQQEKEELVQTLTRERDSAEEGNKAKSNFLATMSHEIRTPMNGLMGMLEILRETRLDAQQMTFLNTAYRSAEALLDLLNDILDYSKIEAGRLDLEQIPFDWFGMIGELAVMNRVLANEKGINFHLHIPCEGPSHLIGDPTRLRQILTNLLSNAQKFTHEGSITLSAGFAGETETHVMLRFEVQDTGIGISEKAQQRLFQQFTQADSSTTRRYGGTGLGLAISQRLAALMGGRITFRSDPGKGSLFAVEIPFKKAAEAAAPHETLSHRRGRSFVGRILLVEDDPVSQRVMSLMLRSFGITPTVVDTAFEAVARVENEEWDLIFMDFQLPDMDGITAARQIRDSALERGLCPDSGPIIVALTANNQSDLRQAATEAGMCDFVPKPVRKKDLRECLERWLQMREHAVQS